MGLLRAGGLQRHHDRARDGCSLCAAARQPADRCVCKVENPDKLFPHNKLGVLEENATRCNVDNSPQKALELQGLLLGLERRLLQLESDTSVLEREDDGDLYGVISLKLLENELLEVQQLLHRLRSTTVTHQRLTDSTAGLLDILRRELGLLEVLDSTGVVKTRRENRVLMKQLDQCGKQQEASGQDTPDPAGPCALGWLKNVSEPRVFSEGEFPGSHKYGAWGRDPRPPPGKESWYWLVMMTSGNSYANSVRRYSSLRALIAGESDPGNVEISSSNPGTDTIQGPNVVLYGEALYYNCYNRAAVCRFNLTSKSVTSVQLPAGTRYNSKGDFCSLDECHKFTDLDLATDEGGVWVVYTTIQHKGNLVLSKVQEGDVPMLNQTWSTSVYKQEVTNTFMVCGTLYATRYIDTRFEEIFYSFDTTTGAEKFNLGIFIHKMSPNIYSLNYSPLDQALHLYCDSKMVSYKLLFSKFPF
ncbi:olfactomedin-4-like isoform X1 [Takifugu flavidus]|uniref:olfactomedin-4-like isoform X1 n=1 Tax=Takifugu flavidus TaxID=433684 RepID=UPI00254436C3|nr:olfactomedin-4-like isoform X1 [Takifugu flavidus]